MSDTWIDIINVLNLIFGAVCFLILFARTATRRLEYPREVILLLAALAAVIVALLITSLELLLIPNELAPLAHLIFISVTILAVKIGVLWVLYTTRDALYRTGERHAGIGRNADEMDVNENFADHPQEGT